MITDAQLAYMRSMINDLLPDTGYVLSLAYTNDGYGGITETWGTAGTISCRIDPLRGGESLTGAAVNPYHGFRLTAPYDAVISEANRIKVDDEIYAVLSVDGDKSAAVSLRADLERL